jgi:hypothetical protein
MSKPYQAHRIATETGTCAAFGMTVLHALNGLALSVKSEPQWALLGDDPAQLAAAHLALVLLGALLTVRLWRTGGVVVASVLMGWTLLVCLPGPATWLYGHMRPTTVHWGLCPLALGSLVAAWRLRRLTAAQDGAVSRCSRDGLDPAG